MNCKQGDTAVIYSYGARNEAMRLILSQCLGRIVKIKCGALNGGTELSRRFGNVGEHFWEFETKLVVRTPNGMEYTLNGLHDCCLFPIEYCQWGKDKMLMRAPNPITKFSGQKFFDTRRRDFEENKRIQQGKK